MSEYEGLPEIYQQIIQAAAFKANTIMMARYDRLNPEAFAPDRGERPNRPVLPYPDDVHSTARWYAPSTTSWPPPIPTSRPCSTRGASTASRPPRWFGIAEASITNFAAQG